MSDLLRIPTRDILEGKTIEELKDLMSQWGELYANRFEVDHETYQAIRSFYISCSMMHENLVNGWRRWWRITIPVSESRYEESVETA